MEAIAALQERLRSHHERITANHDSIGHLRGKQARQETDIAVMRTEMRETREDIVDMKQDFTSQLTWVRRGLWAAAGTFLMFTIALATLIVAVFNG